MHGMYTMDNVDNADNGQCAQRLTQCTQCAQCAHSMEGPVASSLATHLVSGSLYIHRPRRLGENYGGKTHFPKISPYFLVAALDWLAPNLYWLAANDPPQIRYQKNQIPVRRGLTRVGGHLWEA